MKLKRSALAALALCALLLLCGLAGCIGGLGPYGYGSPYAYGNVDSYGYGNGGCVPGYSATQFLPGPFGKYYRVDGVIVGNPIYGGIFYPNQYYLFP